MDGLTIGDALTVKNRDAAMNNKEVTRILASQGKWGRNELQKGRYICVI